ncbi:uncharacterized protein LOC143012854 [Genypterus blacodes]|uniref:uncharacterized protein LOC143012854 n=1 Tax=Genypterus blacodes TaxID=154954 RepID=UPI003F77708C
MVCFRLSTPILLAAACLFFKADVDASSETVTTCATSDNVHRLSCDTGVISVLAALYGRADRNTCSEGRPTGQLENTECAQQGTVNVLKTRCDGKSVCELDVNVISTSDPCSGTYKYLETNYTCLPAHRVVACENSLAHLHCDAGLVIDVHNADFGRRDTTTCFYKRPASQLVNVYCSTPTNKVAESCNGKNSCKVSASNSVFGDTCVGTYKYLELAYSCLYPEVTGRHSSVDFTPKQDRRINNFKTYFSFAYIELISWVMLFIFSVLAAACLLCAVGSTEKVITCDGSQIVQHLSCDQGVIIVEAALYGRTNSDTCTQGRPAEQAVNTKCSLPNAVKILKRSCDGKKVCEVSTTAFHSLDPCEGTYKYVETTFNCFPANRVIACEHSLAYLHCDAGQVILVYGADYGRRDKTTCSSQRPDSQLANVHCSNPTTKVAESCNGKTSCTVAAGIAMFPDPCVGTYKYLEVAYTCICEWHIWAGSIDVDVVSAFAEKSVKRTFMPVTKEQESSTTGSSVIMLSFQRITTIWLAAACLLIQAGFLEAQCSVPLIVTAEPTNRVTTCDSLGNIHRLTCESGVISVQTALYGRANRESCSQGRPASQLNNVQCSQSGTVDVLRRWCNGKKRCELNTDVFRTSDPCSGIYKYVETAYVCVPANRVVVCEHSSAQLLCDAGQVIFVYGAEYGRSDMTTCSFKRVPQQIANTNCPANPVVRHTCIVSDSCNGKSNCTIRASNSVFQDPCVGTYKSLEVAYVCGYL